MILFSLTNESLPVFRKAGKVYFCGKRLHAHAVDQLLHTLDDLLDAAELISVRRENENRAAEAARG